MKKIKLKKSLLLAIPAAVTVVAPLSMAISCDSKIATSYDFGLAAAPINSLNYIRFKDTAQVVPSMVEGLFKMTTTNKIMQKQLNYPQMDYYIADGSPRSSYLGGQFYDMRDVWGTLPGTGISSIQGNPIVSLRDTTSNTSAVATAIQLNSKHKWSNGDFVTAQDYIDAIKYILDINTGSQIQLDLLEFGIKNARQVVDAQNEYLKAVGVPYQDPFAYDGNWESQNANDQKYVDEIKKKALGLGVFTKEEYHVLRDKLNSENKSINDYHKEISWFGGSDERSARQAVDDSHVLFFEYDDANQPDIDKVIGELQSRQFFLPVNRNFVESHGGIQKFGIDKEHFLWNSAYIPTTIELGPAGYIELEKDPLYYNAQRTVTNKIKIFFQADPMVLASMFEDGYIGQIRVPATHQLKFWSDLSMRPYLKKQQGFGTQAFALNYDTGNVALKDDNFRKAIAYALNRTDLTKVASQETSFPVTTWTAFGLVHDGYGAPLETYFDGKEYTPYNGAKDLPIQSYPYFLHDSKAQQFEKVERNDVGYNEEYAKHFIEEYKKGHPEQSGVTLSYIYDGQPISKNIGIYLQSQLRKVFGGFVNVDIKGLPSNVFQTYKDTGKFDILFYNFDSYGQQAESYVKRFFQDDSIDTINQKLTGFKENPSGGWTYGKFFEELESNPAKEKDIKDRLKLNVSGDKGSNLISTIDPSVKLDIWAKIKELSKKLPSESLTNYKDRIQLFFNFKDHEPLWRDASAVIQVVASLEKIIREAMPVIPLMEIDTYWEAKNIAGIDSLATFSLQTAYSVEKKPMAVLPGQEAL